MTFDFRALLTVDEATREELRIENAILDVSSLTLIVIAQLQEEAERGE